MVSRCIYSLGHSNHSIDRFLELVSAHQIRVITDVRSTPQSSWNPQFNREALTKDLAAVGVSYVFLGRELGARSTDPSCYKDGQVQFDRLAQTDLFKSGLDRLESGLAKFDRIAMMCAEGDPLQCHRSILISRELAGRGVETFHILPDGRLESPAETEGRLIKETRMAQGDIFETRDRVELACEAQANKIAYTKPSSGGTA